MERCKTLLCIAILSLVLVLPLGTGSEELFEEDIVVPPGEDVILSDKSIILEGGIDVQGTLTLDNVSLVLNNTAENSYRIRSEGVFQMRDSKISSYEEHLRRDIRLELNEGLNLLSFPFYYENKSVRNVLSPLEGSYDSAWYYNASSDEYESYKPSRAEHFNTLKNIDSTMGVLVNITDHIVLEIDGLIPEFQETTLFEGWNMVSFPSDVTLTAEETFSTVWDNLDEIEEQTPLGRRSLDADEYLKPGRGYWVRMGEEDTWDLDIPHARPEEYIADLGRGSGIGLTFEDGSEVLIENSVVLGSGCEDAKTDVIIKSDHVSIRQTDFFGGNKIMEIYSSSPTIRNSIFEGYLYTALTTRESSVLIKENKFNSQQGAAISTTSSTASIIGNIFSGNTGVEAKGGRTEILENEFFDLSNSAVILEDGEHLIEDNEFEWILGSAINTIGSETRIVDNKFDTCSRGITLEASDTSISGNVFTECRYAILSSQSNASIDNNELSDSQVWGMRFSNSSEIYLKHNLITDGAQGIRFSGKHLNMYDNYIGNNSGAGVVIFGAKQLNISSNEIRDNQGVGLRLEEAKGIVINNLIRSNIGGGIWSSSSLWFSNNNIQDNEPFGVHVEKSSPLMEQNLIFGNDIHGIRCEDAEIVVRGTSVLGGRYHLYSLRSNVTIVDSYIQEERIWKDRSSIITYASYLNITMEENDEIFGFDLESLLPPGSKVTGVEGNEPIDVRIHEGGVDFVPERYFSGIVNMTFNVTIIDDWDTVFPFSVVVTPVNNPPIIEEIEMNVTYQPTRVRWVVNYTDPDGYPPTFLEIVIDGDHYSLKEVDVEDTNYSEGKLYYFETHLDPGEYTYYFVAEDYNPHGENITVRTTSETFFVEPPPSGLMSNWTDIILLIIILIMSSFLIYNVVQKGNILSDDGEHMDGENWLDDINHQEHISGEYHEKDFKELTVLTKKGDRSSIEKRKLPVMKKKEDKKKKHRVVKEEMFDEKTDDELEEPPEIDIVGEVEEREDEEEMVLPALKKQRSIKREKKKWSITKKQRAVQEKEEGKKTRIIKE